MFFKLKLLKQTDNNAIQVGFDDKREVLSNKPAKGHVAKANTAPKRFIREFKNVEGLEVGAEITVETFAAGDIVDVTGTSKVKVSKVLSNATDNHVDLWLTVLVTTVVQVQWDLLRLTVFSKTNTWQDVWVATVLTIQNLEVVQLSPEKKTFILIKGNVPGC